VELFEELQCARQIGELIHQVDLRQKGVPHISELRIAAQPGGKLFAPGRGNFINDASRATLGGSAARAQQALLLEPFQAWIDLAEFGGPEMADAVVQDGLQVVSAGRPAEKTEQNMFEAHGGNYITLYINVNCLFVAEHAPSALAGTGPKEGRHGRGLIDCGSTAAKSVAGRGNSV